MGTRALVGRRILRTVIDLSLFLLAGDRSHLGSNRYSSLILAIKLGAMGGVRRTRPWFCAGQALGPSRRADKRGTPTPAKEISLPE